MTEDSKFAFKISAISGGIVCKSSSGIDDAIMVSGLCTSKGFNASSNSSSLSDSKNSSIISSTLVFLSINSSVGVTFLFLAVLSFISILLLISSDFEAILRIAVFMVLFKLSAISCGKLFETSAGMEGISFVCSICSFIKSSFNELIFCCFKSVSTSFNTACSSS